MSETFISMVSCAADTKTRDISVEKVLEGIRIGGKNLKGEITRIRNRFESELAIKGGDLKAAKLVVEALKKELPAVMWCGQFSNREQPAADKLLQHSGLLCADLDELGQELPMVRERLQTSPHLFALFLSPTGNGLKAVVRVPADASKHAGSYRAVEKHVRELTGVQIDQSGKDVSRLCFLSHDPEIYVNENAQELEPLPEPEKPHFANISLVNLSERQRIATELLGDIEWTSETSGYCVCPGKHLHTTGDGERDCAVHLDGAPNIHCFHGHCKGIEAGVNHELRSRIGKAEFVQTPRVDLRGGASAQQGEADEGEDATIARLAALSPFEYDHIRKVEAKKLECRVSILDSRVHAKRLLMRPSASDNLQGEAVIFTDIEPWPEPVDGAEVLKEISRTVLSYVIQPQHNSDTVTLWSAGTHCFAEFQISPRLQVTSPEGECGKTTLRDLIGLFSSRPQAMENLTPAVLFRIISAHHPTILADEYDTWIYDNDELRGLFNAGHRKGGRAFRIEGEAREVRSFDAYAPTVLCGLGRLPGTLPSRSIKIPLERASKDEKPKRFDSRHVQHEVELCRKLARWVADNRVALAACNPVLPEGAFNRVADNWRPLFAIAEVAGGEWPQRCLAAFENLTRVEREDTDSLRIMLLIDIREVFRGGWPAPLEGQPPKPVERIFSKDLNDNLEAMTERPWPEVRRGGKAITVRWLASNLAAFGIHSKNIRIGEDQAKGYERAQFDKVFAKYIPEDLVYAPNPLQGGNLSVPPSHTEVKPEILSVPEQTVGTDGKGPIHEASGRWDGSATGEGPRKGESDAETLVGTEAEPVAASIPVMLTRQMEADLRRRGFTQAEINRMTPQQANNILAGEAPENAPTAVAVEDTEGEL